MAKALTLVGVLALLTIGFLAYVKTRAPSKLERAEALAHAEKKKLEPLFPVPVFSYVDQSRAPVTNTSLVGKVWVANFIFTRCPNICPKFTAKMGTLQDRSGEQLPALGLVSFTVDPENDTPERLAAYAARFEAMPGRWFFLRGSVDSVAALASLGFMMGDSSTPALHSTRFALVDRAGMIRGYFDGTDARKMDELREAVRLLAEEGA